MKTDTADAHWNTEWAAATADSKWAKAEPDVIRWAATLAPGSRILDLGAGIGRHALALARDGFAVTALDAAPEGIAAIRTRSETEGLAVETVEGRMTELPFTDGAFDHVLSWNVIYHGDGDVVAQSIAEIARVLRPGGTFLGTMLSARRVPVELAKYPGREISANTWVFEGGDDKIHPHYFCDAAHLVGLFAAFEPLWIEDRVHDSPGSWHWHVIMERR